MRNFKNNIVKRMAALALTVAGIGFAAPQTFAQNATAIQVQTPAAGYQPRTIEDLQQLAGPVALYPDALLAQVLVAATYPDDVLAAAQYLQDGGDPNQVAGYAWDASAKGLLQTPDALNQLANNTDWMNQLGDAFLNQQQDLMNAVQALRQQAQANGNLSTTAQQEVETAGNCIEIVPANPQFIYVPVYDPAVVYVRRCEVGSPFVTFCPAVRVGLWLGVDFDWLDYRIYSGSWGFSRPWWRHGFDYAHGHPGIYVHASTGIRSAGWVRNGFKPGPRHLNGAVVSHTVRSNFRSSNIVTHGPSLRRPTPARTVASHTTVNVKKTVNAHKTNVVSHVNRTVASHTVTKSVSHSTGKVSHATRTVASHNTRKAPSHAAARPASHPHQVASAGHGGSKNVRRK